VSLQLRHLSTGKYLFVTSELPIRGGADPGGLELTWKERVEGGSDESKLRDKLHKWRSPMGQVEALWGHLSPCRLAHW
jgi:hypothetical protein